MAPPVEVQMALPVELQTVLPVELQMVPGRLAPAKLPAGAGRINYGL